LKYDERFEKNDALANNTAMYKKKKKIKR